MKQKILTMITIGSIFCMALTGCGDSSGNQTSSDRATANVAERPNGSETEREGEESGTEIDNSMVREAGFYNNTSGEFLRPWDDLGIDVKDGEVISCALDSYTGDDELVFPDNITSIGERAFYNSNVNYSTRIDLSNTQITSIGDYAFSDCRSLTSIELPDQITSIGDYAFLECVSLTSIELPDNITSIGDYAFDDCISLTSIELPDNITSIGENAFSGCDSLTSIDLPDNITSIGGHVFDDCVSLTSIELSDNITSIGDSAFYKCSSLTSIELPNNITSIDDGAFCKCSSLTSIDLSNTQITSIGYYAFAYCDSLTSIDLPDTLTEIGDFAFDDCSSLTNINYAGTMEDWNAVDKTYCFGYDPVIETITCKDGVITL